MSDFDNSKQVVLSKVVSDSDKAPAMRVNFEIGGEKFKAGLWAWTKKDGTPVTDKNGNQLYKGNYEVDTFQPQQSAPASEQPAMTSLADDIGW